MYDAFEVLPVLEKLPLPIECIACYADLTKSHQDFNVNNCASNIKSHIQLNLLVGTKPGHLLVYKVQRSPYNNGSQVEVTLEKSLRSFSKRPIQQMFVSSELKVLICLTDNSVIVYDLIKFEQVSVVARNATIFAADLEEQISSTGDAAYALKLCIAVKRKLQFYFWKNGDFVELHADVVLPEVPKCLCWCRDSVCLGLKREYMLVKLTENEPLHELCPTGKSMDPVVGRVDSDQLVVMKDDISIFIDGNGSLTYQQPFLWSENPAVVESHPPFLLGILPKSIEIRTVEPKLHIQNTICNRAKLFSCLNDWLFVSSSTHIWLLQQRPIPVQVDKLVACREFGLALKLAKMSCDQDESEKMKQVRQIRTSLAFELFCQRKFEESLRIFADLQTDPVQVIGLFPDLLPSTYQNKLNFPSKPPLISGTELNDALHALIELLTDKRNKTLKWSDSNIDNTYPLVPGNTTVHSKSQLLQIIDTTLLKCYLKTNNALVAHLLRLPDNHCHVEEAERVLNKAGKFRELIELYKNKGLHNKALTLLLDQSKTTSNKEDTTEDMIEYLQHIGPENLDLIFEFATNLFKIDPTNAIRIFTGDTSEVEALPKKEVSNFLRKISQNLLQAYLEHIIFKLEDETPEFHNQLAVLYKDKVISLIDEYHDSLPEVDKGDFNNAPVDLTEARKKLSSFLEHSTFYNAERILSDFPEDYLIGERALLLGRLGQHQQALALYTYKLGDPEQAEKFCLKVYEQNPDANSEVFLSLLKMYLHPESARASSSASADEMSPSTRELDNAMGILHRHSSKFDAEKALMLLPESVSVRSIRQFLCRSLETLTKRLHHAQVLQSLLLTESHQTHEQRIFYESRKCVITDERICKICKKKIGVSAFARYPNDVVVHYYCCKDRKTLPSDQW